MTETLDGRREGWSKPYSPTAHFPGDARQILLSAAFTSGNDFIVSFDSFTSPDVIDAGLSDDNIMADFEAGPVGDDVVQLNKDLFEDFAAVLGAATQTNQSLSTALIRVPSTASSSRPKRLSWRRGTG